MVRLSVDLDAAAVHIDVGTPISEPRFAATVDRAGTGEAKVHVWEPLLLSSGMRRRLPDLAAHAWQRALETQTMPTFMRLLQSRRAPDRPAAAVVATAEIPHADPDLFEAGQVLGEADVELARGADPKVDVALAAIYAEIDEWIEQYGPGRAPDYLKDPAALCAAIAMVFHHDVKDDPTKVVALAAGAMTRLILPLDRHQLPPDPFEESSA